MFFNFSKSLKMDYNPVTQTATMIVLNGSGKAATQIVQALDNLMLLKLIQLLSNMADNAYPGPLEKVIKSAYFANDDTIVVTKTGTNIKVSLNLKTTQTPVSEPFYLRNEDVGFFVNAFKGLLNA